MLSSLVAIVLVLLSYSIWRRLKLFRVLWKAGHVGPRGNIISGSYFEMKRHGCLILFEKWFKEYKSDTIGFYYGTQPFVISKNLDLAKQILIKDFQNFKNRANNSPLEAAHPMIGAHLLFTNDDRWERIRNFMTPSFSTVNLREMFTRLTKCMDVFMENLEVAPLNSIDVYPLIRRLTLDNIARAAFSVATNVQENPFGSPPKFQIAAERSIDLWGSHWLSPVALCLRPVGQFLFRKLRAMGLVEHPQDAMSNYMEQLTDLRNSSRKIPGGPQSETEWVDFMQNLINGARRETMDSRKFHRHLGFKLSRNEVVGNCLLFFLAAFETTSSALSFLIYSLAREPEIRARLRHNLQKSLEETGYELSYDFVMNHRYLDMVINEGLRLYPTANGFLGRATIRDYEYKGIKIPAGVDVLFPAFHIHRDPKNFPEPEKFDPERFSPDRKNQTPSLAYLPFGAGKRSCIGNRFALMQMKQLIARIVLKYDFHLVAEKHRGPLKLTDRAFVLIVPGEGIHVKLVPI
ncbi:cytochrome P450 3A9 [Galendromus occidentalis]|uniref:Cytochrome P450 3A9 n=1 Tax=Galendromus occidentalis TaxID=34638 RepID=A0AAJ6QPF2_9ACAR|nr:cytochrome P450 3A9 [Galendromus occidentalis]